MSPYEAASPSLPAPSSAEPLEAHAPSTRLEAARPTARARMRTRTRRAGLCDAIEEPSGVDAVRPTLFPARFHSRVAVFRPCDTQSATVSDSRTRYPDTLLRRPPHPVARERLLEETGAQ